MSNDIKVSVIVPFYKVEKYFRRCLDSIINQTLKELEIILIDDCGGDKSIEIAEEFAQKDSRIKIVINEKNSGQGYSRNVRIRMAKGEYIAFVDSDDWLDPTMYEKLYNKANEKSVDIIKCGFYFMEPNGTIPYDLKNLKLKFDKIYKALDNPTIISGYLVTTIWNGLYKKEFLIENSLFFDEIIKFEDGPFSWQTLMMADSILFLDDFLYYYFKDNINSDTSFLKYAKYYIIGAKVIQKLIANQQKEFTNAYILHCFRHLIYVFDQYDPLSQRGIFKDYYKLIEDCDKSEIEELYLLKLNFIPNDKLKYYINNNYCMFKHAKLFKKIKRSIKYFVKECY